MPAHILLLGAHGKVALQLLPLLLARSWSVTALIRDAAQTPDILNTRLSIPASSTTPGKLDVLVENLEDVKSPADASRILGRVKGCNWVIWAAGAGGKGGPTRTNAIDRDAAIAFAHSIACTPSVTKYLLISAMTARRRAAPWWSADDAAAVKVAGDAIAEYTAAKLAADEVLTFLGEERRARERMEMGEEGRFSYVILRPGLLTDEPPTGRVRLGRTRGLGRVSRGDVAAVAAELLGKEGANGWYDVLEGERTVEEEVERVVREGENSVEGERFEEMRETMDRYVGAWREGDAGGFDFTAPRWEGW